MAEDVASKATGFLGKAWTGAVKIAKPTLIAAAFLSGYGLIAGGGSSAMAALTAGDGGVSFVDALQVPIEGLLEATGHLSDATTWIATKLSGAAASAPALAPEAI